MDEKANTSFTLEMKIEWDKISDEVLIEELNRRKIKTDISDFTDREIEDEFLVRDLDYPLSKIDNFELKDEIFNRCLEEDIISDVDIRCLIDQVESDGYIVTAEDDRDNELENFNEILTDIFYAIVEGKVIIADKKIKEDIDILFEEYLNRTIGLNNHDQLSTIGR